MGVSLSDGLRGWVEQDLAAYELALLLGVLPPGTSFATEAKHVFWSSNELGDALQDMLKALVRIGALEYDPEDERYRWAAGFEWQAVSARPGR